jgi:solute carrier family 6 GABA transporter-like protein 1
MEKKYFSQLFSPRQGVFIYYIISYSAVTYDDYVYPGWAEGMGLCISFSSMIWIPAYFFYYLLTEPGTIKEVRILFL